MKNLLIPQTELQKLASDTMRSISIHSLSQWIKLKTEDKFVILPRQFAIETIDLIENNQKISQKIYDDLNNIKFYL